MNKKGIELSVNFLVMLVLALVVFGFGIFLVTTIFNESTTNMDDLRADLDSKLDLLACNSNDVVCIIGNEKTVNANSAIKMGITVYNYAEEQDITISLGPVTVYDKEGNEIPSPSATPQTLILEDRKTMIKNQKETFGLGFGIPKNAEKGSYEYILTVSSDHTNPADKFKEEKHIITFTVR